jgi:hypothetical protein
MVKIEAVLHPEEAELVWTMLNHAATQLTREPAPPASDDSAEACGGAGTQGRGSRRRCERAPGWVASAITANAPSRVGRRGRRGLRSFAASPEIRVSLVHSDPGRKEDRHPVVPILRAAETVDDGQ